MTKKSKKKLFKIFGIVLLMLVGLLIAIPIFLEGKIADIIKNKVNQNINASLDFEEANLSLIKSFPDAYVDLKGISLINNTPFEGDTLFSSGDLALEMSIKELFKGADEPIAIKSLKLDQAKLHIKVDVEENTNYDIAKDDTSTATTSEDSSSSNFTFDLESYEINNTEIIYDDFATGMHLVLSEMNHSGSGDLSLEDAQLQTKTDALVSFQMDSTKYLNNNKVSLDAVIGIDLKESKYTFLENKVLVNQLPLVFDGFVKVNEDNQEVDITFNTPSSDFKNFLAVIPEAYSANIENVTTTGNFEVAGQFKGIVDEEHIPAFDIQINSQNASFKYPDLPKTVKNVFIDTKIKNESGITEDTYVDINKISFQIDEDIFNLNADISELLGNTKVNLHADGKMNLANISKAYPITMDLDLSGVLTADMTAAFDMVSIEKKQYGNTKTNGQLNLSDFKYSSEELKNPVAITKAGVTFNPNTVTLNSFEGKTGQTDFKADGTITNLLGFLFNEENVEGNFKLRSDTFALNDFMMEESESEESQDNPTSQQERIKIPSFLDATIDASAATVIYDNLNLKNVSGQLIVKDEAVKLQNLSSELFDGKLNMNGSVSTKGDISTFDMTLGMDSFKISESFKALDLFRVLAPVAQALQGKLNSDFKISGNLKDDMTPNLSTLTGNLVGELLSAKISTKDASVLTALNNSVTFIDLDALDLKDLKTALSFENGRVSVKPFSLNYKDVAIKIDGSHSFNEQLEYQAILDVPAKYLGDEVNGLIAKIDDSSLEGLTIPVTASIGGTYASPNISTDLKSGVTDLTKQLVDIQKQKLVNQGKDTAKDLLGGLLGDNKDSTKTDSTKTSASDVLGGLLGNNKKDSIVKDSTKQNDAVKDAAKNLLGGLLGGKKKKKDTVN
ncbi:AsmA-like C-terminal region-containing protein [Croceitalea rosinachiae]|uniref:AsmA-like C-terminal region-containing protein n=1 Tax=Croceitalea rosinachiae TaxID=3075596 RepID=A0ABU3A6U6_9FLAO|nr:AsmA-like C-terminal region-containing protein [Croceitalea sp. F388]MDT0605613.1 AsmA-like C-terminal region-containing protein [Croceitalea sp. F388]